VQGLAGAYDLSREFLNAARSACDQAGAFLIFDEVQTGMGRLGAPFGANLYSIEPDILTTAKGLAGGFPAGAVLMQPLIARDLKAGQLGTTFGGGPLASAAIAAVIDTIDDEQLLANVNRVAELMRQRCIAGPITGIQGKGFLTGLKTRMPAAKLRDALLAKNILTGTSADPKVLRLLPALVLKPDHLDRLVDALGEVDDGSI
jgi:acetylornithine/succinyldiaminopimelate/putrescine aminotransferase